MNDYVADAGGICKVWDLAYQRDVRQVHRLGVRVLAELLAEIDADPQHDVRGRLARYAQIRPDALRDAGGDRFPAQPLMVVPSNTKSLIAAGVADRDDILQAALNAGGDAA